MVLRIGARNHISVGDKTWTTQLKLAFRKQGKEKKGARKFKSSENLRSQESLCGICRERWRPKRESTCQGSIRRWAQVLPTYTMPYTIPSAVESPQPIAAAGSWEAESLEAGGPSSMPYTVNSKHAGRQGPVAEHVLWPPHAHQAHTHRKVHIKREHLLEEVGMVRNGKRWGWRLEEHQDLEARSDI